MSCFVSYKKECTRLAASSDKVYQLTLLAHGPWFSLGIPASSTTNTGGHDIHIAESGTKHQNSNKLNMNRIGGVMVSMLAYSVVDRGFEPKSVKPKTMKLVLLFVASLLNMQP